MQRCICLLVPLLPQLLIERKTYRADKSMYNYLELFLRLTSTQTILVGCPLSLTQHVYYTTQCLYDIHRQCQQPSPLSHTHTHTDTHMFKSTSFLIRQKQYNSIIPKLHSPSLMGRDKVNLLKYFEHLKSS